MWWGGGCGGMVWTEAAEVCFSFSGVWWQDWCIFGEQVAAGIA
jgi:hypothetical protein